MSGTRLLPPATDQYAAVEEWIRADVAPGAAVLDVGAGDGDHPYPRCYAGVAGTVTGVDPDEGIRRNLHVDVRVQATLEQFAPGHEGAFDVAVAMYVAEHVDDPRGFLAALRSCLRPGASAYLLTPNRNHYFGLSVLVAYRLHIDEWLLRRLRDEGLVGTYHFPVRYRMNSRRAVRALAAAAGFSSVEFRMIDHPGIYEPYMPRPLRWLPARFSRVIHRLGLSGLAGTMLVKLTS